MTNYSISIPSDSSVPRLWKLAIESECCIDYLIHKLIRDKRIEPIELVIYLHHFFILNWLIKLEWDDKHKLAKYPKTSQGKNYKRCYRVVAELYQSVLQLCENTHSSVVKKYGYLSATEWFFLILKEGAIEGGDCLNAGKYANKLKLQKQNHLFGDYINKIDSQVFPHTSRLIEISMKRAEINENFRQEYWSPFVRRRKTWTKELERPEWNGLRNVDGQLREATKGRNTQRIPAFLMVFKNGVPKILES